MKCGYEMPWEQRGLRRDKGAGSEEESVTGIKRGFVPFHIIFLEVKAIYHSNFFQQLCFKQLKVQNNQ